MPRGGWTVLAAIVLTVGTVGAGAASATTSSGEQPSRYPIANLNPVPAGAERLHYEVGPLTVRPGQNSISFTRRIPQPAVDGYIVGMRTNLRRADGTVPPVNVIHLHHGVWINFSAKDSTEPGPQRFFAAGEEKTIMSLPAGYGYAYHTSDSWVLNWMLHNNLATPDQVWITYDIDLIPATSPMATNLKPAIPIWMDVQNGSGYPVFNALKGHGKDGQFTYPDDASDPYPAGIAKNEWVVPEDGVLLTTAGHVHPGGMHDDLWLTRAGAHAPRGKAKPGSSDTVHLFESVADYFEPAGKVSWDFAVTGTPSSWRPTVQKGDVLSISTTYDTKDASWYESMGIMVVWMAPGVTSGGTNPFAHPVDASGELTHGHLSENDQHGGKRSSDYTDLTKASSRVVPSGTVIPIMDFAYAQGNMAAGNTTVPAIVQGGTLTFRNDDASKGIYHTITACAAPCDASFGIAYPIPNAKIQFDSAELGHGGPPASGAVTWSVPRNLPPGTYTYFCRIHPFMRGAFRVLPSKS